MIFLFRIFIQLLTYIIVCIPIRYFFGLQIHNKNDSFQKGTVFFSNHISKLDFIIIFCSLPLKTFIKLLPIQGLVSSVYMNTRIKFMLLRLCGFYPVGNTKKEKAEALFFLMEQLDKNATLLLFPEGTIDKVSLEGTGAGAGMLLQRYTKKTFIPINISGFRKCSLKKILQKQYSGKVFFGKKINHKKTKKTSSKVISRDIMINIQKLSTI